LAASARARDRARTRDLRRERPEQRPAIELTRKMSRIHAPHVEGRFGADASGTLLCAAVYLGMFENRQMNASKLADYVGVPRSTMDLEELERVGRFERRGTTAIEPVPYHVKLVRDTNCRVKSKRKGR
jgi:hypothetical protein